MTTKPSDQGFIYKAAFDVPYDQGASRIRIIPSYLGVRTNMIYDTGNRPFLRDQGQATPGDQDLPQPDVIVDARPSA
jgi:hypothetical protein